MSDVTYLTPDNRSVKVRSTFNKVCAENFGDGYCGKDTFYYFCHEEPD